MSWGVVAQIERVYDNLVDGATINRHELDTEITAAVADVCGIINAQHARLVELVSQVLEHNLWTGDGLRSPAQWVAWQTGLSPAHAAAVVRVATQRAEFPRVTEVFERGELALDQVAAAVTAPPWADRHMSEFAPYATVTQIRRVMRSEYFDPDPDQPHDDAEPDHVPDVVPVDTDRCSAGFNDAGRYEIHAHLNAVDGAVFDAAIGEARDQLIRDGQPEVTWADALLEMAHRSLDGVTSLSRRDRYRVWVHLETKHGTPITTLTNGIRLPQALVDQLGCDATVQPVWERDGLPFSVGSTQPGIPARTRTIVSHRDQGCRVPGCTASRWFEIHHIVHREHGGPTDTSNLITLCAHHHRLHHRSQLGLTGNADLPDGIKITNVSGNVIRGCGRPNPPNGPPPQPEGRYRHPTGERLQLKWVTFTQPRQRRRLDESPD